MPVEGWSCRTQIVSEGEGGERRGKAERETYFAGHDVGLVWRGVVVVQLVKRGEVVMRIEDLDGSELAGIVI
jgi:hypothetical protein